MRALLCLVSAGLLLSACGSNGTAAKSSGTQPAPGATSEAGANPSIAAGQSGSGARSSPKPASRPPGPGGANPASNQAIAGTVNPPRPGAYTYSLSGDRTLGGATSGPYSAGARAYVTITANATPCTQGQLRTRASNSEEPGADSTACTEWHPDRVLLTFTELNLGASGVAPFDCTPSPAIVVLHIPVRIETFATQTWSGSTCSGTTDIKVVGQENVAAAGKTWNAWKITSHTTFQYSSQGSTANGTVDATDWLAPELGVQVQSDTAVQDTLNHVPMHSHQVTSLLSYPA